MSKKEKLEVVKSCPNFPFFGASYPDAGCIDGELWDLDNGDGNVLYSNGDNPPCPFCNTESFIEYMTDMDDEQISEMNLDPNLSAKDRQDIMESNMSRQDAIDLANRLKSKYL